MRLFLAEESSVFFAIYSVKRYVKDLPKNRLNAKALTRDEPDKFSGRMLSMRLGR